MAFSAAGCDNCHVPHLYVVDHYDAHFSLKLSDQQKTDLVEFLKSL